ncbi:efflux RND transporter permease subunit [Fusobacterium simiae]|uniref:Efflux RND transporter permease subunit n=1 Tax=Fusobacterium simiae TaxID=855 RepID=A0ABT4DIB8_FUSSI|nr:efflux RND transporter permease subunit [Fusobacterium simiae]MCY7007668.1 efflux RND transporter permease subunit [Fusobacterium simiae]
MKIIEYSIKHRVVIIFATIVLTIAGIFAYFKLGKLEDPEFKVKEAIVVTLYPGASPESVEQEVTDKIEIALRKIPNADVDSVSKAGYSEVHIKIEESTPSKEIDQQWDIVRKKINDVRASLPLGALTPVVLDDYGDVYGMFFAITSEGFSKEELYNYVKDIRKELEKTDGIAKTTLFGNSDAVIEVLVDRNKIANLGINEKMIALAFTSQNIPAYANSILHGNKDIRFDIDQSFKSVEDIENLVIYSTPPILNVEKPTTILLKDIAEVRRTEVKPYTTKMRFNGKESIGLMLSPVTGTNVVETGKEISKKLEILKQNLPYGIEIEKVYYQPELVSTAINQFIINLIESVVVVVGVLLITMGIRSGFIIGSGLILSILGTLIVMIGMKIDLQRVSLGAFIIAMGMLVDNSIVVVDGVLDSLDSGNDKYTSLTKPTEKTAIPLLGATFIAIIAFLPMYLMPTTAGEYIKSLFWVVAVSLGLSWIISLTQTTVFCDIYLSENKHKEKNNKGKKIYESFSKFLEKILIYKKFSILILLGAFLFSLLLFIKVPFSFFPDSDKKGFVINLWNPEGTDIEYTNKVSQAVENEILKQDGVISVTSAIGASPSRYYIATIPELPNTALSQLILSVKNLKDINKISESVEKFVDENFPDTRVELRKYANGMPTRYPIQLRIIGNDEKILREYSKKLESVLRGVEGADNIQTDWKEKILVIKPELDKVKERESLVTALDIATSLNRSINGINIGTFKDGEESIPVMFKEKNDSREFNINSLGQVPVWGLGFKTIPFRELIKKENLVWENPIIIRKDGLRAIQVQADVKNEYRVEDVRKRFAKAIDENKIELPEGYKMEWNGEYYEQQKNTKEIISYVPLQMIIMFMTCVLLFGNLKDPIIIFGVLPLSFIGILPGLFITGRTFGFMAIIGTISLSGMMIKSAIVLIDEIRYEIYTLKKEPFKAIIDSSVSRIRAVSLAAGTTVLGMMPLMFDPLFSDMAITIVFGLTVTTFLILFVVPLLYSIFYKINKPEEN